MLQVIKPTFQEIKTTLNLDESKYEIYDISEELYREYEHGGKVYRIEEPILLVVRKGGTTHRVVDSTWVTHCHPIPGNGVALRWCGGIKHPINF